MIKYCGNCRQARSSDAVTHSSADATRGRGLGTRSSRLLPQPAAGSLSRSHLDQDVLDVEDSDAADFQHRESQLHVNSG